MRDDVELPIDAGFRRLRVASIDRLTADAAAVTFDVPEHLADEFRFRPGQHLALRRVIGGLELRRNYSVCSSAVGGPLRVAVKRLDGGAFSTWVLDNLQVGGELEVLPPVGGFGPAVDPQRTRRYGLIAAGSGITPVLSIAATVLEVEERSEVALVYGNRTSSDVMFVEELSDLKDRFPDRLLLLHVLSREEQESELLSGRIDRDRLHRLFATLLPIDSVDEWYLCGPFGMVTEGRQTLLEAGVPPGCVHIELFHADPPPPRERALPLGTPSTSTVTVVLHGRTTTLPVERDGRSVLDAVLAVRADAPYACKSGVCGTCRARCVVGSVEMDANYALEPKELDAGVVLTCQSHPTSDEVRLEYL